VPAAIIGGLWAVATWYWNFSINIETERTKQKQYIRDAEEFAKNSKELELTLQKLRTEEQQTRERISRQEIAQREKELQWKTKNDEAVRRAHEIQQVAHHTSGLLGSPSESQQSLASLIQYAKNPHYRDIIIIALSGKIRDITTFEEAQLAIKLARAIEPADFDLIAGANRVAYNKMRIVPLGVPESILCEKVVDVEEQRVVSPERSLQDVSQLKDRFLLKIYSYIFRQSADMLVDFIEAHQDEPLLLDISGCRFCREPKISSSAKVKLIRP
jgi:hypothetical protein